MREQLAKVFPTSLCVCTTEKRLICVLQETTSNMADYEVLHSLQALFLLYPSKLPLSLPLLPLLYIVFSVRVRETSSKLPEFKLQEL